MLNIETGQPRALIEQPRPAHYHKEIVMKKNVLALQKLPSRLSADGGSGDGGGGGGGSTLTVLGCESGKPSNLSLVLCH